MKTASQKPFRLWLPTFLALSLADLGLTWWLLQDGARGVYEANPIAAGILRQFGWLGLAGFKSAVVLLVVSILILVARHRPQTARRVLQLGCAVMLFVVTYSTALATGTTAFDLGGQRSLKEQLDRAQRLEEEGLRSQAFRLKLIQLGAAVARGEVSPEEAVDQLAREPLTQDRAWIELTRSIYPELTLRQVLRKRLDDAIEDYAETLPQRSASSRPSAI